MKFLVFGILFCLNYSAFAYTKGKVYKLTILHTNDHHGRFWANKDGEWGLAARSTLIQELRDQVKKDGGHVLLLDAGDVNTGVPQSDVQDAEPDFRGMAKLHYDVMALGNHEFDNPIKTIMRQKGWAGFPFVSANIYDKATNKRVFPSHIQKKVDDLKVTIFGLTTEDTPQKSTHGRDAGLLFTPAVEEARKLVPTLRKDADVLIALTHIGHYPDESHGPHSPGDVTLARQVNGIDLIVGGHTQKPLFEPDIQNGSIIVQAYEWGKYVGKVDLEILDGKVKLIKSQLIPVNLKDSKRKIPEDPQMLSFLRPFKDKGDKGLLVEIGKVDGELNGRRDVVRSQETNLGNLITLAYKEKFNADVGLTNSGGIRDSLYPGKITLENIITVLPFAGEVVTAQMKGNELTDYLQKAFEKFPPGQQLGGFPQLSGVQAKLDKKTRKIKELVIGGKPVDKNKKYVVALPKFVATEGDGYPKIENFVSYGFIDADILKEYIEKKKELKVKDYGPFNYISFEE
jgi:5'-nucleotidase/UDP-sugar diphosphatase